MLSVSDLMSTAVVTIRADATLADAHADMETGMVHHLPVVDGRRHLVGILSDRDILRTLSRPRDTTIAEIMTREVITVKPDHSAQGAANLMLERRISALPVVSDDGALIGVITQTDYLELARRALLGLPLARD